MQLAGTFRCSPNIALIKYWGRRDDALNLPNNSSVSMTLDSGLSTRTSVLFSDSLGSDVVYVDGNRYTQESAQNEKLGNIFETIRYMRGLAAVRSGAIVVSENSFPSGAGLASSASGGAALVCAADAALGLGLSKTELSLIARRISGSACRSLFGGIALWKRGSKADGSDSFAEQLFDEKYWSELVDVIAMSSEASKKVSSSEGHSRTVRTSGLYKLRPALAEASVGKVIGAIRNRDFNALAELIMRDSNNMHATMLDSWPPIIYMSDVSTAIISSVHAMNKDHGENIAAYTFDAGPNAHVITLSKHEAEVRDMLLGTKGVIKVVSSKAGTGPERLGESLISEEILGHEAGR